MAQKYTRNMIRNVFIEMLDERPAGRPYSAVQPALMMSQILEALFNLSDVVIAGKFADYRALGSVGSTTLLGTKDELIDGAVL